jgi:hypothetical protein
MCRETVLILKIEVIILVWLYTPITPVLQRLRQEDIQFEAILSYINKKRYIKNKQTKNPKNDNIYLVKLWSC